MITVKLTDEQAHAVLEFFSTSELTEYMKNSHGPQKAITEALSRSVKETMELVLNNKPKPLASRADAIWAAISTASR